MAVASAQTVPVTRIERLALTTNDAGRLLRFYERAFHCRDVEERRLESAYCEEILQVRGGASCYSLKLGVAQLDVLQFDRPGRPYPADPASTDLFFQHFAVVVRDMSSAVSALSVADGWTPISRDGPQRLPSRSGGVSAFKFRDPDGHPLELLEFPADGVPLWWRDTPSDHDFLGIDHSAIVVSDPQTSIPFYERLGLRVTAHGLNQGVEQQRLDHVPDPQVDVIALSAREPTPHLELLHYRDVRPHTAVRWHPIAVHSNDVAATRLTLSSGSVAADSDRATRGRLLIDPDGHRMLLI